MHATAVRLGLAPTILALCDISSTRWRDRPESGGNIDLRAVPALARDKDVFAQISGVGRGYIGLLCRTLGQRIISLEEFKRGSNSLWAELLPRHPLAFCGRCIVFVIGSAAFSQAGTSTIPSLLVSSLANV
jgi:hypothetical protein